jgi:DNA-binding response OmpR family regulator
VIRPGVGNDVGKLRLGGNCVGGTGLKLEVPHRAFAKLCREALRAGRPKTKKNMEPLQTQNSLRPYNDGRLYIDLRRELVILESQVLPLTRKEYCVLVLLVQHAGEAVPRKTISMQVWGHAHTTGPRKAENHIRGLRSKLGIYANRYIETVRRVGYRFRPASRLFYKGRTYSC